MKEVKMFIEYASKDFKALMLAGACSNKYRTNINSFLADIEGAFNSKYLKCAQGSDFEVINFENIIDTRYRYLVRNTDLRKTQDLLDELIKRVKEFESNEGALSIITGFYIIHLLVVTRLLDVYMETYQAYKIIDKDVSEITLSNIGIDNEVLKYFKLFETIKDKTIDDWLKTSPSTGEEKYISSAIKRILLIFGY